ncbi:MAG: phage tail assembly protein [Chloroflexi bacterium]|nr:phage tail assembly protein [Chloroflexota bacterium]
MLQTEFSFVLPCGYVDPQGDLHREGTMRRATALDEVEPLEDPRVQRNEAYLSILLLSRVITRLGSINAVTPAIVERLFATDFLYLQDLYMQVNAASTQIVETQCPSCGTRFTLDVGIAEMTG